MKNWKDAVLKDFATIRDAMKVIDRSSLQIVMIVNQKNHLMGTVTDGDIRRGILRGISLDQPVKLIMQKRPTTANVGDPREKILALMRTKMIRQIPILDAKCVVVGLQLLDELMNIAPLDNWVVIMAGGLGKRLSPLTDSLPKPLIPVGTKPILETIVENFVERGFRNFYLAVNYKDHMIKKHFGNGEKWKIQIEYLSEAKKLGTAGALGLLSKRPSQPVLVMNGDLLTKVNFNQLLDFHQASNVDATMCVREYDFQVPYGVIKMDDRFIRSIDEKPVHKFFVNAGIYVLGPHALKQIPKESAYDMPQLFERLIKNKKRTAAFPIHEYWLDIGKIEDLNQARIDIVDFINK